MADSFTVVGAVADVELVGGDQTQDVQQITVQAKPSGVVFPVRVPLASFTAEAVTAAAAPLADALNELADDPGITSVTTLQDVTAAGQLEDRLHVTVVSDNGNLSTTVDVPLRDVLGGGIGAKVEAARANLNAVAEL